MTSSWSSLKHRIFKQSVCTNMYIYIYTILIGMKILSAIIFHMNNCSVEMTSSATQPTSDFYASHSRVPALERSLQPCHRPFFDAGGVPRKPLTPTRAKFCKHCFNGASHIRDPIVDFNLTIRHYKSLESKTIQSGPEQGFLLRILPAWLANSKFSSTPGGRILMTRCCWTF